MLFFFFSFSGICMLYVYCVYWLWLVHCFKTFSLSRYNFSLFFICLLFAHFPAKCSWTSYYIQKRNGTDANSISISLCLSPMTFASFLLTHHLIHNVTWKRINAFPFRATERWCVRSTKTWNDSNNKIKNIICQSLPKNRKYNSILFFFFLAPFVWKNVQSLILWIQTSNDFKSIVIFENFPISIRRKMQIKLFLNRSTKHNHSNNVLKWTKDFYFLFIFFLLSFLCIDFAFRNIDYVS